MLILCYCLSPLFALLMVGIMSYILPAPLVCLLPFHAILILLTYQLFQYKLQFSTNTQVQVILIKYSKLRLANFYTVWLNHIDSLIYIFWDFNLTGPPFPIRWVSKVIRKRHESSVTSVAWHPNNVSFLFLVQIKWVTRTHATFIKMLCAGVLGLRTTVENIHLD